MEVRIRGFDTDEYVRFAGSVLVLVSVLVPYVDFDNAGSATLFRLIGMADELRYPGLDMIVVLLLVVLGAGVVIGFVSKIGGYLVAVGLLYFDLVVVLGISLKPMNDASFASGFYLAALAALLVIASDAIASAVTE